MSGADYIKIEVFEGADQDKPGFIITVFGSRIVISENDDTKAYKVYTAPDKKLFEYLLEVAASKIKQ